MKVPYVKKGVLPKEYEERRNNEMLKSYSWMEVPIGTSFSLLFSRFVSGEPIKRKDWRGYWRYNTKNIEVYMENGEVMDLVSTEDIIYTISQILADDWIVATTENSILKK